MQLDPLYSRQRPDPSAGAGPLRAGGLALVRLAAVLSLATLLLLPTSHAQALTGGLRGEPWARSTIPEGHHPFVAEVLTNGIPVLAYPNPGSVVRRQANAGDLLRVTGQAPGIDGDDATWWATTEGYVPLDSLQPSDDPQAATWTLPEPDDAPGGWWGELNMVARVRTAPTTDAPVVGRLGPGQRVKVLAEEQGTPLDGSATWYRIDGGRFAGGHLHGSTVTRIDQPAPNVTPPDPIPADGTWITVDRGAHTLTLVQGGNPVFSTYVAIGKVGSETPTGTHPLTSKRTVDDMTSLRNPDALNSYYLPNVPFVQYYLADGSAIHGTYWHDGFGSAESQGCVNLTLTDAAYLFDRTSPEAGADGVAWSDGDGTPVVIVD